MRIYAVADIHGKLKRINTIREIIGREKPDLLIIAGDIFNFTIPENLIRELSKIDLPIVGVRGNSDLKCYENKIRTRSPVRLLGSEPLIRDGFSFVGVNGTLVLPFISKVCLWESRRLAVLAGRLTPQTILVAHPPPRGACDKVANRFRAGSSGLRKLVKDNPPMMVLCGHIHEQAGYEPFGPTWIVNCAINKTCGGAIIDCDMSKPVKIKMMNR